MEFFEVLQRRFSVRAYQDKPVDDSVLGKIFDAVNGAPSAFNLQAYEIVVVREAGLRKRLAEICWGQIFIAQAPVVLAFFANPDRNREKLGPESAVTYSHEDTAIACDYAHLATAALGLGSCWIAAYGQKAITQALGMPESWQSVALLPLGYPAENQPPRERRPVNGIFHQPKSQK